MSRFTLQLLAMLGLLTTSLALLASPPKIEQECQACHGVGGNSQIKIVPNLACQKEQYLVNAMMAYREGRRVDASMSAVTGSMLDVDIKELAAYYSKTGCAQ